ncbi:MAG: ABC transporter ATP-binding protein [Chloroflexota bacterium]|nr:MAG: ABC transporter ATP-binding protein [Chloroflexota bacterium]
MAPIIEIINLSKAYGRSAARRLAVDRLDLSVEEGDIFGFVGPNGAGKTSTIRIMATLLQATSGDIRVAGHSVSKNPRGVRKAIGYMPDFFGVYNDMTVWEYLDFFGACYKIPPATRAALIDDLLELVDLTHRRDDMVDGLSRGMKQRLSLARTLVHDPQVLILDEPASGLDPRARIEIRTLMVELAQMGKTIFFSTHILADVAEICTRVGIIEAGRLVASGPLEELQQHLVPHRRIQITVLDQVEKARDLLQATPGVLTVETPPGQINGGHQRLEFEFAGDDPTLSALLSKLVEESIPVVHFSGDSRDMEEVFMRATKGLVT